MWLNGFLECIPPSSADSERMVAAVMALTDQRDLTEGPFIVIPRGLTTKEKAPPPKIFRQHLRRQFGTNARKAFA